MTNINRSQVHDEYCALAKLANSIDTGDSDVTDVQIYIVCNELRVKADRLSNLVWEARFGKSRPPIPAQDVKGVYR